MTKRCIILILSILCTFIAKAQEEMYYHDSLYQFIILTKDTVNLPPQLTDQEFYEISEGVVFKVNRTELREDDPFLKKYRNEILPYVNSQHLQLRKVYVRGAASPEGPYDNNRRLGIGRTKALIAELQRGLLHQYTKARIETSSVTEDYGFLCYLMEEAKDADYAEVKGIYDSCNGNELQCKQKLMKAQGGKLWNRLLKEYFPTLRAARIALWFSEPDAMHAPISKTLIETAAVESAPSNAFGIPTLDIEPVPYQNLYARRHLIAFRTNLVHDFFYMPQFGWAHSPNYQLEYYPLNGHYTYNIGMTWGTHRHWNTQEFFQVRDFQIELRRYFVGKGKFIGPYLGAYINGGKYGIGLNEEKGWEGEGGGLGITGGLVIPINRKGSLRLELMGALGFYLTRYDPYVWGNPITGEIDGDYYYNYHGSASTFKKRNHQFTWVGPTNIGIQLTYDIIYRKKHLIQEGGVRYGNK